MTALLTASGCSTAIRQVTRPPRSCPTTAKRLNPKARMTLDLVKRHRPLRVVGVILAVGRLAAVSVATKIGHHHGELLGETRRDLVPLDVGLWIAVQEQQRRTAAPAQRVDRRARCLNLLRREARKHGRGLALHLCVAPEGGGCGQGRLEKCAASVSHPILAEPTTHGTGSGPTSRRRARGGSASSSPGARADTRDRRPAS